MFLSTKVKNFFISIFSKEDVEQARGLLDQIQPLIDERNKIEDKRKRNNTDVLTEKLFQVLDKIYTLSTEYYYLMPKKGFEFTRYFELLIMVEWKKLH